LFQLQKSMLQPFDLFRTPKTCTSPDSTDVSVVKTLLSSTGGFPAEAGLATKEYTLPKLNILPAWLQAILNDFRIIFERDPAASNWLEVLCCYPGLHALLLHRVAHWLHKRRISFIPRLISHLARFLTGIEIHPGAVIGSSVFIDHGMGVVIGETAVVGDYTLIYQGATLGGTGKQSGKRHPTLGKNVVVGAGAKVLGNIQIGDHVRIGAGSIVLRDVPDYCTVVGVPGRIICPSSQRVSPLEHGQLPDAEAAIISALQDRIQRLEQQLQTLKLCHGKNDDSTL
jgi:serine O-acetyltransferase